MKEIKQLNYKQFKNVHKDVVTSLTATESESNYVSTSLDGFIKMMDSSTGQTKKAFFVCQSGINASTPLSSTESFALAAQNHNIYVFSFVTGTVITNFYAHDDLINSVLYKDD